MPDFEHWKECWETGNTPWQNDEEQRTRFAERFDRVFGANRAANVSKVFVPLCGTDPALLELAERGYHLTGLDYVEAVTESLTTSLFGNHRFTTTTTDNLRIAESENLRIIQGDIFDFAERDAFDLVYDRGALVALEPEQRAQYAAIIANSIRPGKFLFLVSLYYQADETSAATAPFPIHFDELQKLFPSFTLEERDDSVLDDPVEHLKEIGVEELEASISVWRKH